MSKKYPLNLLRHVSMSYAANYSFIFQICQYFPLDGSILMSFVAESVFFI